MKHVTVDSNDTNTDPCNLYNARYTRTLIAQTLPTNLGELAGSHAPSRSQVMCSADSESRELTQVGFNLFLVRLLACKYLTLGRLYVPISFKVLMRKNKHVSK